MTSKKEKKEKPINPPTLQYINMIQKLHTKDWEKEQTRRAYMRFLKSRSKKTRDKRQVRTTKKKAQMYEQRNQKDGTYLS